MKHITFREDAHKAASRGLTNIIDDFLDGGGDVNAEDANGASPLLLAAYRGQTDTARHLLDRGADVNWGNKNGYTPLMVAAREGYTDTVQLLLERGANINAVCKDGLSALMYACCYCPQSPSTKVILNAGADVNAKRSKGLTPLMYASSRGAVELVNELIVLGANITAKSDDGKTASDFAREQQHGDVVKIFTDLELGDE